MFTLTIIIHIIASIVLIIAVLFQAGKGASISSTFGGASSQTLFGSSGPTTFLAKVTTGCAVIFMLTSLYLTYTSSRQRTESLMSEVPAVSAPPASPAPPAPAAAQTEGGQAGQAQGEGPMPGNK